MTIPRFLVLLAVVGALGLAVVALRADQTRRSHHIQKLQYQQLELRRRIQANQVRIARQRSPQMIRDRAQRFDLPVTPPYEEMTVLPPDEAWVAD